MRDYKILLLSPSFEDIGGVTSFCRLLIKNLKSNFEVDHLQIGNKPGNKSLIKRLLFFLKNALRLRKKLVENGYNIIHLNPSLEIFSLLRDSFYLAIISKFYHNRSLVLFHGWNESLAERIIKNLLYNNLFRRIYKKAKFILVLCNQFKEQLIKMGIAPERIKVITTMYQGSRNIYQFHKNKLNNKINILFMSRLVKSKGVYIATEVAKLLFESRYKNFKLIIAGNGPEYAGLMDYINRTKLENFIDALGFIKGKRKQEILENSDIFLFPSSSEGCPIVILEAMGAGLAVVTPPVGAIPDIVKHNENGLIVDSKDPKDFYEAIKRLIEDRKLLNRIQRSNRKKAEENYEAKIVTRKMESIYISVIND